MTAGEVFAIGACALCVVVLGALVKRSSKEYALLMSAVAAVAILLAALGEARPLLEQLQGMAGSGAFDGEYLAVMLKAVGITMAGQLTAQLCRDGGESALAWAVELAVKLAVLAAAFPVLLKLFQYLEAILSL